MKRIKKYILMALMSIMVCSFAGCNLIERTQESIDNTVYAKVGDTKITKGEVEKHMTPILNQLKAKYGDNYKDNATVKKQLKETITQVVNTLVDWEVLYQSAGEYDIDPDSDDIQAEIDKTINQYKESAGSDDAYNSMLEQYGYDDDSFKAFLKKQTVVNEVTKKIKENIDVTDEDVENYYNDNLDTYTTKAGADVTHVVFQFNKDSDGNLVDGTEDEMLQKANEARQKVLSGTSLKDIANSDEYKDCAKYEDLGRVSFEGKDTKGNSMEQKFTDGFKDLPANQVSEPVKTSYGYHLIINTNVYPNDEVKELDDSLKQQIKSTLLSTKQQDEYTSTLDSLKEKIGVKTYEDKIE